jgi:ATP-dependent DNA helicase DinG
LYLNEIYSFGGRITPPRGQLRGSVIRLPNGLESHQYIMMYTDLEISRELQPMPRETPAQFFIGEFMFTAFGCALFEIEKNGKYIYTAVNIETGKSAIVSRRLRRLTEIGFRDVAEQMRHSRVAGRGRFEADRDPRESMARWELAEIMEHIFVKILPRCGYSIRENQVDLAGHILETISRRGVSLAESEVGTGKTHAYLIAAILAKRGRLNDIRLGGHYPGQSYAASAHMPIIVATSSIALQRAIVQDFIPELSGILEDGGIIRKPLSCFIRKGKEHYLCEKRLKAFYDDTDAKTREMLKPLLASGAPCDLAESEGLTAYMKRRVCVSGKCGENCRHNASCRYMKYLAEANSPETDFIITNHNYFLADVIHRNSGKRPLLPHYQAVIIDEGHKFLAAARQMYGLRLTDAEIPALCEIIHSFTGGKSAGGVNIHRLAKKLDSQSKRLFRELTENAAASDARDDVCNDETERFPVILDSGSSRHLLNISAISGELIEALADSRVAAHNRESRSRAVWELEELRARTSELRKYSGLVCWLEKPDEGEPGDSALCSIPKDMDSRLFHDVWSMGVPIVLTSGTLSAGGDFTRTKQALGLDRIEGALISEVSKPSPFDYSRNTLLYLSENVPFPDNSDSRYISAVTDEIERLVRASHGHAAVLFTSYKVMGLVYTRLRLRDLPFPLFRMGRQDVNALEQFRGSGNGILFASGAMWEGIDIPGDALSLLIIVKLPFAAPDSIGDYEKTLYGGMEEYKLKALVPDMLVKLKQGHGRLIRTETDTGAVAILDSRANRHGAYHARVQAALPMCRTTGSIGDVEAFIRKMKRPGYFA